MLNKQFIPDAEILKWKYEQQVKYEAKIMAIMKNLDRQLQQLERSLEVGFESAEAIVFDRKTLDHYKLVVKRREITNVILKN